MIEEFTIFTEGGVILWSKQFGTGLSSKDNPLNQLIGTVLLEERAGEETFSHETMNMKWTRDNQLQLVFVCMYQKVLQLLYVEQLLTRVKKRFVAMYKDSLGKAYEYGKQFDFEATLEGLIRKCEQESMSASSGEKVPRSFEESKKWEASKAGQNEIMHGIKTEVRVGKKTDGRRRARQNAAAELEHESDEEEEEGDEDAAREAERQARLKEFASRKGSRKKPLSGERKKAGAPPSPKETKKAKPKKEARSWDGVGPRSKKEKEALDFSDKLGAEAKNAAMDARNAEVYGTGGAVSLDGDYFNEEDEDEEEDDTAAKSSGMFSMFTNLVQGKVLDADDLAPVLAGVRESLVEKNVAVDIADSLCESVSKSLQGKRMESWTGVKGTVKQALEQALTRILTPKQSLDIVREIHHVRSQQRPYVIVFCGVNGVGKSTSLAKVCNWLLGNDMKVLIAACDTFRAGAVEQLKVHSRALGVEVFDQGYGKDAATIANEAVKFAGKSGHDVVLVDTAGRMQDNEPLMRALAKLVALNKPDLCLFVGEALVGNDSVDQLKKFNQALADHALNEVGRTITGGRKQYIDGIFLTKFDTVDDKIGAALSMVYETGQPIVFVGVGQTYKDIRRMNVGSIVRTLCK